MKNCSITFCGSGNSVEMEPGLTRLKDVKINVFGSGCKVFIGAGSNLNHALIQLEDNGSSILIGKHVTITRNVDLSAIEGTSIEIGEDCLFADGISVRTGDSHSILDKDSGKRINPSKGIIIGEHVWIGAGVRVLKGAVIGGHSVVAAGAIVTGKQFQPDSIIGGCPARTIKESIDWTPERL